MVVDKDFISLIHVYNDPKSISRAVGGMEEYSSSICGGLPPELCELLTKEQQTIKIRLEKRKWGREVTIIEGIDEREVDLRRLASQLKSRLATGGTAKNGRIELQGDHRHRVKDILAEMGFPPDNIIIIE